MKEYVTMIAHWIEICGGELSPQWALRQQSGIRYLHWLYSARLFVSHVKRSSKVSEELRTLQKQQVLKVTPQDNNPITNPKEDEEKENEGDPNGGYGNEERLTRALALRDPVETRWNS